MIIDISWNDNCATIVDKHKPHQQNRRTKHKKYTVFIILCRREHNLHFLDELGEGDEEKDDNDGDEEEEDEEDEEEEDTLFLEEQTWSHNKFSFLNARPGVITYHIM